MTASLFDPRVFDKARERVTQMLCRLKLQIAGGGSLETSSENRSTSRLIVQG